MSSGRKIYCAKKNTGDCLGERVLDCAPPATLAQAGVNSVSVCVCVIRAQTNIHFPPNKEGQLHFRTQVFLTRKSANIDPPELLQQPTVDWQKKTGPILSEKNSSSDTNLSSVFLRLPKYV